MTVIARVLDPEGRWAVLTRERWDHIVRPVEGRPRLDVDADAIMGIVAVPDARVPGRVGGEIWFYGAGRGPSRYVKVVVVYREGEGSVITAFPRSAVP